MQTNMEGLKIKGWVRTLQDVALSGFMICNYSGI